MITAKQVADLITLVRALLPFIFVGLGFFGGPDALPLAGILLLIAWITDIIDGPIARRSRKQYHTWLGDHDLEIDMAVSVGVLAYLLISEFISLGLGVGYLAIWVVIFWRLGLHRSPGMLFQAPIYGAMIWVCLDLATFIGLAQLIFILGAVIITWPRFIDEVVPGFLAGLKSLINTNHES